MNAERTGLDEARLSRVARDLAALSRRRFAEEKLAPPTDDLEALFLGPYSSSLSCDPGRGDLGQAHSRARSISSRERGGARHETSRIARQPSGPSSTTCGRAGGTTRG
jgi:hypothetical protein